MATLYERYNVGLGNQSVDCWGINWIAMSFTPALGHSLASVVLLIGRGAGATPGPITASIRATALGLPAGADLAAGLIDGNTISDGIFGAWTEIVIATVALTLGIEYAIVLRAPTASAANRVLWRRDALGIGTYAGGGSSASANAGVLWSGAPPAGLTADFKFEEWGLDLPTVQTDPATRVT